jgi:hypothetical protein
MNDELETQDRYATTLMFLSTHVFSVCVCVSL